MAFRFTAAHWALLAALAPLYVLAGKLGLHFAFVHASATAVWPPTSIALAAFLLFGPHVWPALAVGAFPIMSGLPHVLQIGRSSLVERRGPSV